MKNDLKSKRKKTLIGLVEKLQKENRVLVKLLEARKKSRYAKCFGQFRAIAKKFDFGDDHLGLLMAKNKTMRAFGIKYLKSLSSSELKEFEKFLSWIYIFSHSKIDYDQYKKEKGITH